MTLTTAELFRPASELARGPWTVDIDPASAGWDHTSLRILDLDAGGSHRFDTGDDEVMVLPLSGGCVIECDGERFVLEGRTNVFAGPSDLAYVPRDTTVTVSSDSGARVAIPGARAGRRLEARYVPRSDVSVELRGAGQCSRQVNNFGTPDAFGHADSIIACEVITPAGNWSSYPPHKHDEDRPGESVLEEIYYFVVAEGPTGPGVAYQRVYGTPDRPVDVLAEVRSGDVVLIPHGWHGPSMAMPGYDLYYLNVMAGPGAERAWRICDDPAHAWVRDTWDDQAIDTRLPMGDVDGGAR